MIQAIKNELLKQGITIETEADLVNYFNDNFKNTLTFCKEHSIEIIIDDKEKELLDTFVQANVPKLKTKIDSLDDIMLVHKDHYIPTNDKMIPLVENDNIDLNNPDLNGGITNIDVIIDGQHKTKRIIIPAGHATTHFCINAEVRSFHGGNWDDCDVIIMQPLTKKVLEKVVGTDPADTFIGGEIDLEGHIIICRNKDKYMESKEKNPNALVVYCPNMELRFGDKICAAMGYSSNFYRFNNGTYDKSYSIPENMYSEEFKRKYPIFINNTLGVRNFLEHNAIANIQATIVHSAECQFLMSETSQSKTFDEVIDELQKYKGVSYPLMPPFMENVVDEYNIPYPDRYTYSWENHFPEEYKHLGKLMDSIKTMDYYDPEILFQLIIKDTIMTKENEEAIARLKEMIINSISEYNKKFNNNCEIVKTHIKEVNIDIDELEVKRRAFNNDDYKKLIDNLMLYQEIAHNGNMLKRQVDKKIQYDLPPEYYDYSEFLESIKGLGSIVDSSTFSIVCENMDKIKVKIENKNDNEISNFINQKENISKKYLEKYFASKTDEQQSFATDEYEKNISNFLKNYLEKKV